jgi:hypothetical protein
MTGMATSKNVNIRLAVHGFSPRVARSESGALCGEKTQMARVQAPLFLFQMAFLIVGVTVLLALESEWALLGYWTLGLAAVFA